MADTTVLYLTDNTLDEKIASLCKMNIIYAIGSLPLVSVSHKPIDFGQNIYVGEMVRSSLTLSKQMLIGLQATTTKYVAIAEHDCLYTPEHYEFVPPDDDFWYNENVYMLQTYSNGNPQFNGMFSIFPKRMAYSQLICRTDKLMESTKDRIDMMDDLAWKNRYPSGRIGEPGGLKLPHAMRLAAGKSVSHLKGKLNDYVDKYVGKNWSTKIPNIDIRHKTNYTKNRRGSKRRYELPYWGKMEDVLNWNLVS